MRANLIGYNPLELRHQSLGTIDATGDDVGCNERCIRSILRRHRIQRILPARVIEETRCVLVPSQEKGFDACLAELLRRETAGA